jgi:PAS domain S-box-containing protein
MARILLVSAIMDKLDDQPGASGQRPPGPGPTRTDDPTAAPDPPFPPEVPHPHASETAEREAAFRRARARRLEPDPRETRGTAVRSAIWDHNPAFAALADNVRDYAIFLMDRDGVMTFWGEGAHLMKWWTREEAKGGHLRMLYPEGGSEDGTAEEHLHEAEIQGEYVGEGCRVRRDGSTFWAGVTLTALRDPEGDLIGFAKTTRDLTARRATEQAVATANAAHSERDRALALAGEAEAARDRAEEEAEFAREHARGAREYIQRVLEPEIAAQRASRADPDAPAANRDPSERGGE